MRSKIFTYNGIPYPPDSTLDPSDHKVQVDISILASDIAVFASWITILRESSVGI